MPMASRFQECVAMDLKFCKSKILLHLVDHATRFSMSTVIPFKNPDVILQSVLKNWVSAYGAANKFLSGNGWEIANESFLELCESLNITVKTTGAEVPWSNGLVERLQSCNHCNVRKSHRVTKLVICPTHLRNPTADTLIYLDNTRKMSVKCLLIVKVKMIDHFSDLSKLN